MTISARRPNSPTEMAAVRGVDCPRRWRGYGAPAVTSPATGMPHCRIYGYAQYWVHAGVEQFVGKQCVVMRESKSTWRGACADQTSGSAEPTRPHASWDLDRGDPASWLRALDICANHCPALEQCRALRRRLFPDDRYPVGVIWAGVPYSETGQPLDVQGLRRLAATRRRNIGGSPTKASLPDKQVG